MQRIGIRPLTGVVLAGVVVALFLARSGEATVAFPGPRTLVATHHWIWTVAQDGGRIAWVSRLATHHCGLYVKTLRTGRIETTRLSKSDCDQFAPASDLALANRSAAWVEAYSGGNNERDWLVASATAGDRRARRVDAQDVGCITDACGGVPDPTPYLAGAGRLIVYSNGQGDPRPGGRTVVERIRGGRASRLFDVSGEVYGLSLGTDLIATASLSLTRGDGCGCLDAPAWSPDGSKIAYLNGHFDRYGGGYGSLAVMNADGSGRHVITPFNSVGSAPSSPSWSPDGTKIAYDGVPSGQIWVARADGSVLSKLASGYEPAWSPDGTKIAFVGAGGIFVTSPDGTNTQQLISGLTNIGPLAWSRDGTRIAFSVGGIIEAMNADGSDLHQLGSTVAGDEPAWSPDGSQLVYRNPTGLAVINADGSGQRQLTTGPDEHPSWSLDGKTILFASDRDDAYANVGVYSDNVSLELYLVDADGGNLHPLSFTEPAEWLNAVTIHSTGGRLVSTLPGLPALPGRVTSSMSTTLSGDVAVVAGIPSDGTDQISLFDAPSGDELATVRVGTSRRFDVVGANADWVVFELDRTISALNVNTHAVIRLAPLPASSVDISVSGRRVIWVENSGKAARRRGRIRAVELPS